VTLDDAEIPRVRGIFAGSVRAVGGGGLGRDERAQRPSTTRHPCALHHSLWLGIERSSTGTIMATMRYCTTRDSERPLSVP
jgi:hypothetical protein